MLTGSVRAYLAVPVVLVVASGLGVVLVAVVRLIGPGSILVQRGRLPGWWHRFTAWSRSRSLRVWCPDPETADVVAAHLATATGRRLSRLGVAIAPGPGDADVILVAETDRDGLDRWRRWTPTPTASVVLADPWDLGEFAEAMARLSAALRWPESETVPGQRGGS